MYYFLLLPFHLRFEVEMRAVEMSVSDTQRDRTETVPLGFFPVNSLSIIVVVCGAFAADVCERAFKFVTIKR